MRRNEAGSERERLVAELRREGIDNEAVLGAIARVPREDFVPAAERDQAYANTPLGIGSGQTISQPYVVALMTAAARVGPGSRVLEVGTGSGYQAAVLAELGCEVFSIEVRPELAETAEWRLRQPGWNIHLRRGDGHAGWPEEAPFDAILATAAPEEVPPVLLQQLAPGGRLVIPLGPTNAVQSLYVYERDEDGAVRRTDLGAVRFVPMVPGS